MVTENKEINNNELCVNENKINIFNKYTGCFAIWIPENYKPDTAFEFFIKSFKKIKSAINKFNSLKNKKIILSVEGGSVISGEIEKLKILKKCNVKIFTLTWNGSCEIGDGCNSKTSSGLTKFGKNVIKKIEELGIIIDVSHACDKLFYDVCELAKNPIIASHSNSRKICNHKRNITDDQFHLIKKSGGIVGINFCDEFLKENGNSKIEDLFIHIEYFLSLGGEKNLCIGSDFDGAKTLYQISDVSEIYKIYDFLLKKNYKENIIRQIFYDNANNFFEKI